jgi:hypothetical protein
MYITSRSVLTLESVLGRERDGKMACFRFEIDFSSFIVVQCHISRLSCKKFRKGHIDHRSYRRGFIQLISGSHLVPDV